MMRVKWVLRAAAALCIAITGALSSRPAHAKATDWIDFLDSPGIWLRGVWLPSVWMPVRFINGKVQCASLDGKSCVQGWTAAAATAHDHDLQPLSCGQAYKSVYGVTGYDISRHWCARAFARHYATWASAASIGIEVLFSVNPDGDIECFALDGVNCQWGITDLTKGGLLERLAKTSPLACGDMVLHLESTDGYSDPRHWCSLIKETFVNPTVPGLNPADCIEITQGNGRDEPAKVRNTNRCNALPTGGVFLGVEWFDHEGFDQELPGSTPWTEPVVAGITSVNHPLWVVGTTFIVPAIPRQPAPTP